MADDAIPDDVREFIIRYIDSVAQLEALLLLRANPNEEWDVARTASRLYTAEQEIAEVLAQLCEHRLLSEREGRYRYEGGGSGVEGMVERVARTYSRQLIPVTNMIHAKPRRIRQFADAFKFKKDR
jgi:hypothetical protein